MYQYQQYDPEVIWKISCQQEQKHSSKVGFILAPGRKMPNAPNAEQDIKAFAYLLLLQGTNINKCLEYSSRSLVAYLNKRVAQYGLYKGEDPQSASANTLTLERMVGLFPQITCNLRKLGLGSTSLLPDMSSLGVKCPKALQTPMFAGICPTGPPVFCYWYYFHFSKKVFKGQLSLAAIKERVNGIYAGNFYNKGRRQALCIELGLATCHQDMWSWNPKVRDVLVAAEEAWICIEEYFSNEGANSECFTITHQCGVYHCLD